MSVLPTFDCPVCRNALTWDVVFAHQGVRDAMLALVNAHAEGRKLLRPLLSYVTLFAPAKTALRYERIASLSNELVDMIRPATLERGGRVWPAPLDYWRQGMEEVVQRAHGNGGLRLPLTSHGYLLEVVMGYANKSEAAGETKKEQQRAGHAGHGTAADRAASVQQGGPVKLDAALPKRAMPQHVREQLSKLTNRKETQ
jgi:hypothetical protein